MKRRTSKQVEKKIDAVIEKVNQKMYVKGDGDKYARGLANEGYLGGYAQALSDVDAYIRGMITNKNTFWDEES